MTFTARFVKNSDLSWKGLFLPQKKKCEEQDIPFVKKTTVSSPLLADGVTVTF